MVPGETVDQIFEEPVIFAWAGTFIVTRRIGGLVVEQSRVPITLRRTLLQGSLLSMIPSIPVPQHGFGRSRARYLQSVTILWNVPSRDIARITILARRVDVPLFLRELREIPNKHSC